MFKKPKRNFRSRLRDSESDDENQSANAKEDVKNRPTGSSDVNRHTDSQAQTTNQNKKKEKPIAKVPSSNAILSFEQEEDGDGEVFQVKKPTHSKRIVKQLKKESLKEKTEPQIKSEVNKSPKSDHLNGNDAVQVKTEVRTEDVIVGNEYDDDEFDDDDEFSGSRNCSQEPSVQDFLKSGQIPDANMIHLVRKRRQMAREMGDDFIAIDDTVRFENKSSRLIRDDDNDASDSGEENLALTAQQKETERRRMEERILAAEEENLSETSEHEREWEEQQIRKGVSIPAQPAMTAVSTAGLDNYYYGAYQPYVYGVSSVIPPSSSASSLMAYGMDSAAIGGVRFPDLPTEAQPISLEISKQKLMDRLSEMMDIHRLHVHERDEMGSRRELNQEAINNLTGQTRGLEEQYKFFQETRGYVRDLVECMNEKMSSIIYLDRCMMNLWKDRAKKLVKRHQDDVKDQSLEYTPGKVSAAVPLITMDGPEEQARNRRRADREGRRNRRKHKREAQGIRDHADGMSTDDEFSISEVTKFKTEHDRLINDSSTAFDDVMEDFYHIPLIKQRFEAWKNDYSESYNEAYIGLCLTKLFTPLVKLELVTWNPLEPNCLDIEDSNWFKSLVFYGCKDPSLCTDDPDIKLVPSIIDKVLLPRLTALVEDIWNPLSLQSTLRLVKVIRHLHDDYPTVLPDSKNLQALVKAIQERIKKTLDDDIFMPLYPKLVLENRTSGPAVFFYRQFWLCVKLLKSIVLWNGILPPHRLRQFAFDSLLNRYVVVALPNVPLGNEFLSMCQAVVAAIPKDWFAACQGDSTLPHLENFCRCLFNSAISLATCSEARDTVRQICKILISVQATDHATSLASRVNFKILE